MRYLAILFLLSMVLFTGCGPPQDLPIPLYFDENFSLIEKTVILGSLEEWNYLAGSLLAKKTDLFSYAGNVAPLVDVAKIDLSKHFIFGIDSTVICPPTSDCSDKVGYGTLSFALLYMSQIQKESLLQLPDGTVTLDTAFYAKYIRSTAIHELGHMLGLRHFFNRPGIMDRDHGYYFDLQPADLDAFCLIYECKN